MITTQFQDKAGAATTTHLSRSNILTAKFDMGAQSSRPAVESMLLGIRLRGWLTDSEKKFLDNLAPDRSITFLIHQDQYLHPEGVELFPLELIETAIHKGGEAVFTHRYQLNSNDASDCYTIYTAVINPPQPKPLVLGYFGPDSQPGLYETENRFYQLVSLFREAYCRHQDFTQALARRLGSAMPTIIVNRCSGRVVSLNEAAAKLFHKDSRSLIDLEFGQVKGQLLSILPGHKLKMSNINDDDLYLTVITVPSTDVSHEHGSLCIPDKFLQRMRAMIIDMTKTASNLERLSHKVTDSEVAAVSHQVVEAARELELYMTELDLLPTDQHIATRNHELEHGHEK